MLLLLLPEASLVQFIGLMTLVSPRAITQLLTLTIVSGTSINRGKDVPCQWRCLGYGSVAEMGPLPPPPEDTGLRSELAGKTM